MVQEGCFRFGFWFGHKLLKVDGQDASSTTDQPSLELKQW